jgi:hypothetical protein
LITRGILLAAKYFPDGVIIPLGKRDDLDPAGTGNSNQQQSLWMG